LLASESKAPEVVDGLLGDLDILASFADVVDGAVMIFTAVLEGDVCVFQSILDDLAARLPARRRCRMGNCLLGLSDLSIPGARGPATGSGSPAPWAPPKAGSSLAMAMSSVIQARHPSCPSAVG
jgi:hypothetical protein